MTRQPQKQRSSNGPHSQPIDSATDTQRVRCAPNHENGDDLDGFLPNLIGEFKSWSL